MTPSPASPALDAKGLSKERIEQIKAAGDGTLNNAAAAAVVAIDAFVSDPIGKRSSLTEAADALMVAMQSERPVTSALCDLALSALSARERAEPVTLKQLDAVNAEIDRKFNAASPPVAVRVKPGPLQHEQWRALAKAAGAEVRETPFGTITTFRHMDELIAFGRRAPASSVVDEGMVERAQDAWEKASREYQIEERGSEWIGSYTTDHVAEFVASPEAQVFHRFQSREIAQLWKRERIILAILAALTPGDRP